MTKQQQPRLKVLAKAVIIAGLVGSVSLPVAAKKYRDYREYNQSAYDYAKVVDVSPIVESYKVNKPVEHCWDERVPTHKRYKSDYRRGAHKSPTNEILGAIIGGAIGNQFGNGRGKKVATAAGAVLGASVAHDIEHQQRKKRHYAGRGYDRSYERGYNNYEVVQRCEVRDNYAYEDQVVGYNVAYKYRGNVFHTEMDQHPGKKIKVKVTVNPV